MQLYYFQILNKNALALNNQGHYVLNYRPCAVQLCMAPAGLAPLATRVSKE